MFQENLLFLDLYLPKPHVHFWPNQHNFDEMKLNKFAISQSSRHVRLHVL